MSTQFFRREQFAAVFVFYAASRLCGQDTSPAAFDAASVRASTPAEAGGAVFVGAPRGGPGTADPGQITWLGATLTNLLTAAFEVKRYQVTGPSWLRTDEEQYRYDIAVKVTEGATREQIPVMWRNLLKERFGARVHRESREYASDELTVAKGGP